MQLLTLPLPGTKLPEKRRVLSSLTSPMSHGKAGDLQRRSSANDVSAAGATKDARAVPIRGDGYASSTGLDEDPYERLPFAIPVFLGCWMYPLFDSGQPRGMPPAEMVPNPTQTALILLSLLSFIITFGSLVLAPVPAEIVRYFAPYLSLIQIELILTWPPLLFILSLIPIVRALVAMRPYRRRGEERDDEKVTASDTQPSGASDGRERQGLLDASDNRGEQGPSSYGTTEVERGKVSDKNEKDDDLIVNPYYRYLYPEAKGEEGDNHCGERGSRHDNEGGGNDEKGGKSIKSPTSASIGSASSSPGAAQAEQHDPFQSLLLLNIKSDPLRTLVLHTARLALLGALLRLLAVLLPHTIVALLLLHSSALATGAACPLATAVIPTLFPLLFHTSSAGTSSRRLAAANIITSGALGGICAYTLVPFIVSFYGLPYVALLECLIVVPLFLLVLLCFPVACQGERWAARKRRKLQQAAQEKLASEKVPGNTCSGDSSPKVHGIMKKSCAVSHPTSEDSPTKPRHAEDDEGAVFRPGYCHLLPSSKTAESQYVEGPQVEDPGEGGDENMDSSLHGASPNGEAEEREDDYGNDKHENANEANADGRPRECPRRYSPFDNISGNGAKGAASVAGKAANSSGGTELRAGPPLPLSNSQQRETSYRSGLRAGRSSRISPAVANSKIANSDPEVGGAAGPDTSQADNANVAEPVPLIVANQGRDSPATGLTRIGSGVGLRSSPVEDRSLDASGNGISQSKKTVKFDFSTPEEVYKRVERVLKDLVILKESSSSSASGTSSLSSSTGSEELLEWHAQHEIPLTAPPARKERRGSRRPQATNSSTTSPTSATNGVLNQLPEPSAKSSRRAKKRSTGYAASGPNPTAGNNGEASQVLSTTIVFYKSNNSMDRFPGPAEEDQAGIGTTAPGDVFVARKDMTAYLRRRQERQRRRQARIAKKAAVPAEVVPVETAQERQARRQRKRLSRSIPHLLRQPIAWLCLCIFALAGGVFMAWLSLLPIFLAQRFHFIFGSLLVAAVALGHLRGSAFAARLAAAYRRWWGVRYRRYCTYHHQRGYHYPSLPFQDQAKAKQLPHYEHGYGNEHENDNNSSDNIEDLYYFSKYNEHRFGSKGYLNLFYYYFNYKDVINDIGDDDDENEDGFSNAWPSSKDSIYNFEEYHFENPQAPVPATRKLFLLFCFACDSIICFVGGLIRCVFCCCCCCCCCMSLVRTASRLFRHYLRFIVACLFGSKPEGSGDSQSAYVSIEDEEGMAETEEREAGCCCISSANKKCSEQPTSSPICEWYERHQRRWVAFIVTFPLPERLGQRHLLAASLLLAAFALVLLLMLGGVGVSAPQLFQEPLLAFGTHREVEILGVDRTDSSHWAPARRTDSRTKGNAPTTSYYYNPYYYGIDDDYDEEEDSSRRSASLLARVLRVFDRIDDGITKSEGYAPPRPIPRLRPRPTKTVKQQRQDNYTRQLALYRLLEERAAKQQKRFHRYKLDTRVKKGDKPPILNIPEEERIDLNEYQYLLKKPPLPKEYEKNTKGEKLLLHIAMLLQPLPTAGEPVLPLLSPLDALMGHTTLKAANVTGASRKATGTVPLDNQKASENESNDSYNLSYYLLSPVASFLAHFPYFHFYLHLFLPPVLLLWLCFMLGFSTGAVAPLALSLMTESCYPTEQSILGNMTALAHAAGMIIMYQLLAKLFMPPAIIVLLCVAFMFFSLCLLLGVRESNKRVRSAEAFRRQLQALHERALFYTNKSGVARGYPSNDSASPLGHLPRSEQYRGSSNEAIGHALGSVNSIESESPLRGIIKRGKAGGSANTIANYDFGSPLVPSTSTAAAATIPGLPPPAGLGLRLSGTMSEAFPNDIIAKVRGTKDSIET